MPFFTISGDTEEPIMHDQLSGLAAFVQAVKAGSFAEAAQRMQLTRSAVGKSIARLEHRLGARLFHRTTRHLNLTEDGQAYYERCVRALAELDSATAALHTGKSEPRGRLRVTAPPLFGRHCVAPMRRRKGGCERRAFRPLEAPRKPHVHWSSLRRGASVNPLKYGRETLSAADAHGLKPVP